MKILVVVILLSIPFGVCAQTKLAKRHQDDFGHYLTIHSDSTFDYIWARHMSSTWIKGKWNFKDDTLYLRVVPIYDTVRFVMSSNSIIDSLILSNDSISKRFTEYEFLNKQEAYYGYQDPYLCPEKLFLKKERLYIVSKGRLVRKKQRSLRNRKKFRPWFVPTESIASK